MKKDSALYSIQCQNLIFEEFFTQNKPVNIHLKNIEEILRTGIF